MSKWETVKLKDLGDIVTGNTPKTSEKDNYNSNDIPFIKPSDFDDENILMKSTEFYISETARSKARILPVGSIIVTCIGIIGKTMITDRECAFNQQINAIIPNKNVNSRFIAYSLLNKKDTLQKYANAAVVPIINKTEFSNIEIFLPPFEIQRQIAENLDKVTHLIDLCNAILEKLDLLVKARFVEMFGEPVSNPNNWEKVPLGELAEIKIGPFGTLLHKEDYIANGHALVNPSHIIDGKVAIDVKLTVSDEKYTELSAYHLFANDVIMGRRGEMGRCAVVTESGLLCGTGSLIIRTNGRLKADYIQKIISFPSFKKAIADMAVGQTMPNLNVPIVSSFMIICPPIEVQEQYYSFVEQTDKSKASVKQVLEKAETLKKALMQEYFG